MSTICYPTSNSEYAATICKDIILPKSNLTIIKEFLSNHYVLLLIFIVLVLSFLAYSVYNIRKMKKSKKEQVKNE